jgi:hypothetical protein
MPRRQEVERAKVVLKVMREPYWFKVSDRGAYRTV